jgi:hypothetical protein
MILPLLLSLPLAAFEETLVLGEETLWAELHRTSHIRTVPGFRGWPDLTLQDGEYRKEGDTEVLLHFNDEPPLPPGGAYRILNTGGFITTDEKILGDGAVAFTSRSNALEWEPAPGTALAAGSLPGDFSIEFWLYPTQLADGEDVFLWKGMELTPDAIRPQSIRARVYRQRLEWEFSHFFKAPGDEETFFTFTGITRILPRRWHHHLIRYDAETGLLEYLLDGNPEAVMHTTPTGTEHAEVYTPRVGSAQAARIFLGGGHLGLMDEFRISRRFVEEPALSRYSLDTGVAETRVLDLGQAGARFQAIQAREILRGNSTITYAYRQSDTIFLADDRTKPWIILNPGDTLLENNRGRYLQIRMVFIPDGSGTEAPQLSSLRIQYEIALPPLPPTGFAARGGDGKVFLSWNRGANASTDGYLLYFGTRPGVYFGSAGGLSSPIDVGNVEEYTLEGLQNDTVYYFALTAYGGYEGRLSSEYSDERSARPGQLLREDP